jgi:hypothetical protein
MSRHCQHSSTARTGAIFAYLLWACSECHELFNHEASQSNDGACLRAAGDTAEFLCSAFAHVKSYNSTGLNWYQTLSEWHYHIPESQESQLWYWWYAVHSDPSSDGSPTWI